MFIYKYIHKNNCYDPVSCLFFGGVVLCPLGGVGDPSVVLAASTSAAHLVMRTFRKYTISQKLQNTKIKVTKIFS